MVKLLAILLILPLAGYSQSIYVTTQNVIDLNPERDALSGLAGDQRIKAEFNNGSEPLDVTAGLPITLMIKSRVDDWSLPVQNSVSSTPPDIVWWTIPDLTAGQYELTASVTIIDETIQVFWRYLTLTNVPTAAAVVNLAVTNNISADVNITNVIQSTLIINVEGNTVAEIVQP
jgi:hypothetical protein